MSAAHKWTELGGGRERDAEGILDKAGLWFAALVLVSPAVLFFLWMLSLSLKFEVDNAAYPPILIPERIAWKNYVGVVESNRFGLFFVNSLIVTGAATGLALLIGIRPDTASPACAPQGRGDHPDRPHDARPVLPDPLFLLFQWLGLMGTLVPQVIAHLVITVPIVIWIMIGYFETTPRTRGGGRDRRGDRLGGLPPWPCRSPSRASPSPSSSP